MARPLAWLLSAALVVVPALTTAHPGHTHKILGTVMAVTATTVDVLDRSNEKTTFNITKETKIRVGKTAGSIKDVLTGLRIVVEAEENDDETFVAKTIQLPERAAK
jgi:hypothetical protein